MKKHLSISAAALVAATSLAFAQGAEKGGSGPAAGGGASGPAAAPKAGGKMESDGGAKHSMPAAGEGAQGKSGTSGAAAHPEGGKAPSPASKAEGAGEKAGGAGTAGDAGKSSTGSEQPKTTGGEKSTEGAKPMDGAKSTDSKTDTKAEGGNIKDIPPEKKTQVNTAFTKHKVESQKVDIRINVGVAVPRTVHLYAVPEDVIVIYPGYRHYRYFVVDGQIIIVDPDTFEIVEVIVG